MSRGRSVSSSSPEETAKAQKRSLFTGTDKERHEPWTMGPEIDVDAVKRTLQDELEWLPPQREPINELIDAQQRADICDWMIRTHVSSV